MVGRLLTTFGKAYFSGAILVLGRVPFTIEVSVNAKFISSMVSPVLGPTQEASVPLKAKAAGKIPPTKKGVPW